ncbi:right-handed parallel beta-helix repeat-containing protein [Lentzea jiangxiensis]|uniref:AAA+-type ATPase, SpoVK/Ycf46/Vps4 family n=1 Tax=Lentzea jiangxiensis TaxID=641025 RepID=A0A1H0X6Y4_9PSEU|nr:right-handed parallel beta-helix repeat-containing protein [Lentzea jiangxiensis]SDP98216.1 AAA+-type ATPase, SpoVK/Ycf46/Vps4 family [Lentzea jiangxiensis]
MSRHVLTVDHDQGYRTITNALRDARDGTVISVSPGRYAESLDVTRSVTITAAGTSGVVEVNPPVGSAVRASAAEVQLIGLVLRGRDAETPALEVPGGQAVVEDCEIIGGAWTAVLVSDPGALTLRGCLVTNPGGVGVVVTSPSASAIEDCVVEHVGTAAIVIAERGDPLVRDCTLRDAKGNGIHATGTARGVVERCDISATERHGIALEEGSSTTIRDTAVRGTAAGVLLRTNASPVLEECHVSDTTGTGITVSGGAAPVLRRCRVTRTADAGIRVTGRSLGVFEECEVFDVNGAGIHVDEASNPVFTHTSVHGGTGPGLLVTDGAAPEFDGADVRDVAGAGMRVETTANPLLRRAVLASCGGSGVEVASDGRGRLEDCEIRDTGQNGLHVSDGGRPQATSSRVRSAGAAGVSVAPGGVASMRHCEVSGAGEDGVVVHDGGALMMAQSVVRDSNRHGVLVQVGGRAVLTGDRLTNNGKDGVHVDSADAVSVVNCGASGNSGSGLRVTERGNRTSVENLTSTANGDPDELPTGRQQAEPDDDNEVLRKLEALAGLTEVKRQVRTLVQLNRRAHRYGLHAPPDGRHLIFTGPPGTGKTTVARVYGGILAEFGILRSGHLVEVTRAELVAEAFEQALGGVLFIDDAHTLTSQHEAVRTLVELVERHRDDIVVIIAGSVPETAEFVAAEPGLAARFTRAIEFADCDTADLISIVENMATAHQCAVAAETRDALSVHFGRLQLGECFGNGHTARKVFDEMLERRALRLANDSAAASRELLPADVPGGAVVDGNSGAHAAAQAKLDAMIGLGTVKEVITSLISTARQRCAAGQPVSPIGHHLVFDGPPGTGKTAVARLYGELLAAIGVLRKGHLVEIACDELLGHYVGHSAQLTKDTFERARGGVLLVDEAYSTTPPTDDCCQEAAAALVRLMGGHSDDTVVVIASHSAVMREFLRTTPGLAAHFSRYVEFADYPTDDLVKIVHRMAVANGYECTADTVAALRGHFSTMPRGRRFGNARHAGQVLELMMSRQAGRLTNVANPTVQDLRLLLPGDLPRPAAP